MVGLCIGTEEGLEGEERWDNVSGELVTGRNVVIFVVRSDLNGGGF